MGSMGRARKGTGLAGSDTYSSKGASPAVGAANPALSPAPRYNGVGLTVHPLAQPDGHADRRRQVLVPVSNALTGATSPRGAPSLRYRARNGARISRRKKRAVALSTRSAPSVLPAASCWPGHHGPITRNTRSLSVSLGSRAL